MIGPLTLPQQLKAWRRRGVQCRLVDGRVRVSGVKGLTAAERTALLESGPQVQALLGRRAERRRKTDEEEQQHGMANPPERPRRVVGQHVVPGYPALSRPLHADECKQIDLQRARVLGTVPYGWRKS